MSEACEILVVGGGPAGATAAALLAAGGRDVIICEGKPFPRPKVCGEFMSAQCRPVLGRLGLLAWYDREAGPEIRRVVAFPGDGPELSAPMPAGELGVYAKTMRRDVLDLRLIERARELGARVWQPAHVTDVDGDARRGFVARTSRGEIRARAVVLAHGLARRGGMAPREVAPEGGGYLCFKAHVAGARLPADAIAIGGAAGAYAGLVRTSGGAELASLAFVVTRQRLARAGRDGGRQLAALRRENRGFRRVLDAAAVAGPWLASGPLCPGVRTVYRDGRFFVGNAAGEVHALVGEGITLALRGAAILADTVAALGVGAAAGAAYERAWRREFALRYHAANVFAHVAMRPGVAGVVAGLLDRQPELMRACVASTGKW